MLMTVYWTSVKGRQTDMRQSEWPASNFVSLFYIFIFLLIPSFLLLRPMCDMFVTAVSYPGESKTCFVRTTFFQARSLMK